MESIKVKDYMNKRPVTFKATMALSTAMDKMINAQQTGGPVVDDNNHVVGFLSEQDLIHKMLKIAYACHEGENVADCMRLDVQMVSPEDSVLKLAEEMLPAKPKVYPVVDENDRLIGVISRRDILKAISTQIDDCYHHPV